MAYQNMNFEAFRDTHLLTLPAGSDAAHYQLYPDVYPPDKDLHKLLMSEPASGFSTAARDETADYMALLHRLDKGGVVVRRLRTLPPEINDDTASTVEAMVDMAELVADDVEKVRVCRLDEQLPALQMHNDTEQCAGGLDGYIADLQALVPRAGLWALRSSVETPPHVIGVMDYDDHGKFLGIDVHTGQIPPALKKYEAFWRMVLTSNESVALDDWRSLYPESHIEPEL